VLQFQVEELSGGARPGSAVLIDGQDQTGNKTVTYRDIGN
jgi:hypothetical protein